MSNTLGSGASLAANQSLVSNNGTYILKVTATGIVFLDNQLTGQRLWWKGKLGQAHPALTMETNGDLVFIEGSPAQEQWGSNTPQFPGAYAVLGDNGNLIIYDVQGDPIWQSGTAQARVSTAPPALFEVRAALEQAHLKLSAVEKAFLDNGAATAAAEALKRSGGADVNGHNHLGPAE